MTCTTLTYEDAERSIRELGAESGKAAGSWVADGNSDLKACRRMLQMLDDGDPEAYDSLPSAPLSGEWADGLTCDGVLGEVFGDEDFSDDWRDDLLSAFEDAWYAAMEDEAVRTLRAFAG